MLQNVELILSLAYHSWKLLLSVRRISEIKERDAIIRRDKLEGGGIVRIENAMCSFGGDNSRRLTCKALLCLYNINRGTQITRVLRFWHSKSRGHVH